MKLLRPVTALVATLALVALGAPLAAAICAGGSACPCPGMAFGATHGDCDGPVLAVEMSCCAIDVEPATSQPSAALPGPQAFAAATGAAADAAVDGTLPPVSVTTAEAALARAERRHAIGVFTLHSVFLI